MLRTYVSRLVKSRQLSVEDGTIHIVTIDHAEEQRCANDWKHATDPSVSPLGHIASTHAAIALDRSHERH